MKAILVLYVIAAYASAQKDNRNTSSYLANWLAKKTEKSKLDLDRIRSVCERHKRDNIHGTIEMAKSFMLDQKNKLAFCRNAKVRARN